jgi:hypothetical protein
LVGFRSVGETGWTGAAFGAVAELDPPILFTASSNVVVASGGVPACVPDLRGRSCPARWATGCGPDSDLSIHVQIRSHTRSLADSWRGFVVPPGPGPVHDLSPQPIGGAIAHGRDHHERCAVEYCRQRGAVEVGEGDRRWCSAAPQLITRSRRSGRSRPGGGPGPRRAARGHRRSATATAGCCAPTVRATRAPWPA